MVSDVRQHISSLQREDALLERLIYRSKSQHRGTLHFRKLHQARRSLKLLRVAASDTFLSALDFHLEPAVKRRRNKNVASESKEAVLNILWGVSRILHELNAPILGASKQMAGLLEQGRFMSYTLTVLSILARIRVLSFQLLLDCVSLYNLLAAELRTGNSLVTFNKLQRELPASLECKWDAERAQYNLVEAKANTEANWFVEDRPSKDMRGLRQAARISSSSEVLAGGADVAKNPQAPSQAAAEFLKFLDTPDASAIKSKKVAYVSVAKVTDPSPTEQASSSTPTNRSTDTLFNLLLSGRSTDSIF
ncbi:hypothetical protein SELMODRAFT_437283 [Selaginella moellendorffii]|uniref:Nucleolus and neural progenitor protein-like N-terminal domain-containing protein n=1 Tax=Selaginella moellendorffii TaxID=88036 RepID=D8QPV9_SELML|nr:uncharacterized protein LOC9633543 isoform X1 [Selaginella moellendorffii]EFJ38350.1 hypothetical protein SELMODRAFT_437283 [Selaginella moellendorffii]|eukprot:XP_002960811.1 uncharacterized protein LOC9633543 isoform X1 [Selaginella moellendorffii]